MSLDDPELNLALLHRNTVARSLLQRAHSGTGCRARTLDVARSLRTLSSLGAGLSQRNATGDAAIPRLLADAARRVREHAARQAGLEP